MSASEDHP
jgi:hypothetical protein